MNLRDRYKHFKAWQRNPFQYENKSNGTIRCANCGTEYAANFCPICGQKAGVGQINWDTVRHGVTQIWGMESRSLLYTLLQLLLRPGYLISDYISGRRQVSFPPVKMLVVVAAVCLLIDNLQDILWPSETVAAVEKHSDYLLDKIFNWGENNPGWIMLFFCSFFILPTWWLFRHAPRHDHHTLPEGFFIQVFICTLVLIIAVISSFSEYLGCLFWLIPVYYVITYRQLFGYGLWGTLWRMTIVLFQAIILLFLFFFSERIITGHTVTKHSIVAESITIISLIMIGFLMVGYVADKINKRTDIRRKK